MPSPCRAALLSSIYGPCQNPSFIAPISLHPRSTRALSDHNGTTRTRSRQLRPEPRRTPISRTSIASFTTSRHAREKNYYEILELPITASAGEIKKKFYSLSLKHHPDRNRTDPDASSRFARISAAYNVLGNASKRATYDREHGFHHAHAHQHPMGSHSSHSANLHNKGSYAGSRPASGLSKRRGAFRGPPPSFYEQGGYGRTGRTEEGSWTAGAGEANRAASGGGFASSSSSASAGFRGQSRTADYDAEDPRGFIDRNPLGHFDARGHFRTQSAEDARRRERRSKARRSAMKDEDIPRREGIGVVHFVVVGGMLAFASLTASLFTPSSAVAAPGSATVSAGGEAGSARVKGAGEKIDGRTKESVYGSGT